jgi:hypothetical protein
MVSSDAAGSFKLSDRIERIDNQGSLCEQTYSVLYYKRKNKIHKSKGVSKMDGTLTIQPPPTSVAVLRSDGDSVIFQGQIESELARKGASLQLVDEFISLGSYEVEVLLRVGSAMPSLTLEKRPSLSQPTSRKSIGVRATDVGKSSEIPCQSLKTVPANIPSIHQNLLTTKKHSLLNRKPPPQPKRILREIDNLEGNKDKASVAACITTSIPTTTVHALTDSLPRLPLFQRHRQKATTTLVSYAKTVSPKKPGRKRASPIGVANSTSMDFSASKNFFPGAVGNPDVPHCIKKVLQPHQIEGVSFLWNCLTGHGKVSQISPHCIPHGDGEEQQDIFRGCILGDGTFLRFWVAMLVIGRIYFLFSQIWVAMGLGKSLMTIAIICALHRQNRGERFAVVCPSSLVENWATEFDKWVGKACQPKRVIIKGGKEGIRQMKTFSIVKPKYQSEVLILSYDLFRINQNCLKDIKRIGLLVVDEGNPQEEICHQLLQMR